MFCELFCFRIIKMPSEGKLLLVEMRKSWLRFENRIWKKLRLFMLHIRSHESFFKEFSVYFRGILVEYYFALFQLQQISNLLQQIFLGQLLHFFSSQHLYNALQFGTIQENVVVFHHQQLTNHQNLLLAVLGKMRFTHNSVELMGNYKIVVNHLEDGLLHIDNINGLHLLAGKSG